MQDYFDDLPRVMARRALKKAGLPASIDVGILSSVIKELRHQIESDLKITVKDATLTTPHLAALYQDDVQDICEYAGFRYIIPNDMFRDILWETGAAYAGYGMGLCQHWQNHTQCSAEEMQLPKISLLAVHRSRTALTSTLAVIRAATSSWEPDVLRLEDFSLGSDAMAEYSNPDDYWRDVADAILRRMKELPAVDKPVKIILTGDAVDGDFQPFLERTVKDFMGEVPPIYADDAPVVAAKGAARLRRLGMAPWTPDDGRKLLSVPNNVSEL
jgi:hypothetical protein